MKSEMMGKDTYDATGNYCPDPLSQSGWSSRHCSELPFRQMIWTTVGATAPAPGVGSYTTNALNQYTQVGVEVLLYDDRGNLTSKGLSASYGYDSKNRLLSATVHVAGVSPIILIFEPCFA
jgi:hypothetical protein